MRCSTGQVQLPFKLLHVTMNNSMQDGGPLVSLVINIRQDPRYNLTFTSAADSRTHTRMRIEPAIHPIANGFESAIIAFVPFPEWIQPKAATLTQERFTGPEWVFEQRFDGIRLIAFRQGNDVRLVFPQSFTAELPHGCGGYQAAAGARDRPRRRIDLEQGWGCLSCL